mmetsp:Transcript_2029/g.3159  ORF Transcript_2029/g.3159 Transcript_2029/m.3159 type:complete len:899 (+) Transcript_2029:210-2906(+)
MAANAQQLPAKEQGLFKQMVRFYEEKQYKKANKTGEQILRKFPDHGETFAMKGLVISQLGTDRKEEAFELVRRGLKSDLKSHVCWHVYGLLYRADRDYREAIKCYLNALRLDPDNLQILRDLALLQIQTRDLQGFVDTRQQLLALKPSNRSHWITFALAQHANHAYDMAVQLLVAYEGSLTEMPVTEEYEQSELLLYKALVLDEGNKLEAALTLLETSKHEIRDVMGMLEHRASLLLRLGRKTEAQAQYRELLASNPDHYRWHAGLQAALDAQAGADQVLTATQRTTLSTLYADLMAAYPRSTACQRIPLDFLEESAFLAAADRYVRGYIRKGIPSLFMDLRPLYRDSSKAAAIGDLFESYRSALTAGKGLPPLPPSTDCSANGASEVESPQTAVWVLYFLAQHYDQLGDSTKSLALLDEALKHTPTLVELHTERSKLLRHAGDLEGAAYSAETARRFDLSDRYLNSLAFKALLRADKVEAAEQTAALFVKEGDMASCMGQLHDMQHMWFECSAAAAHFRRKEYGKALKKHLAVVRHFEDIQEDQFDFHSYCVRKTTLRAYVSMLRMEDHLFQQPMYLKAVAGAVRTYLALADAPSTTEQEASKQAKLSAMSAEERKKYKLKKKKEEKSRQRDTEVAATAASDAKKDVKKQSDKKDADPDGAALEATTDPLSEACKLVAQIKEHAPNQLNMQLLAAEVYTRKGRLLLAAGALKRALQLATPSHPAVHRAVVTLCLAASTGLSDVPSSPSPHPTVQQLAAEDIAHLLEGCPDVKMFHDRWLIAHGAGSLQHRVAGAQGLLMLSAVEGARHAVQLVAAFSVQGAHCTHKDCVAATQLLEGIQDATDPDHGLVKQWRAQCAAAWPFSRYFHGSRCLPFVDCPDYKFDSTKEAAFGRLLFPQ